MNRRATAAGARLAVIRLRSLPPQADASACSSATCSTECPCDAVPGSERSMDIAATVPRHPSAGRSINDLHPNMLFRVLSQMGALQLVQTCQLSRIWRYLWRDVPRINALHQEFAAEADGDYEEGNRLFKEFVTRLLNFRNPVPLKFGLWPYIGSEYEVDTADANQLIHRALLCNAESVDVFMWGNLMELDHAAFTSQHLTTLRLSYCVLPPGFFEHLQTGCTVLECLKLEDCGIRDTVISSQTLKVLSIYSCSFITTCGDPASISIRSLLYFAFTHFSGKVSGEKLPLVKNLESLVTAYVTVGRFDGAVTQVDISQFLRGLSSVTKLEFNLVHIELKMENNLQWCPKLNNLKFLTLGEWCLHADFCPLIVFLQNSANLQNLTVNLKEHVDEPGTGTLCGKLQERSFTCGQLETVEIVCWDRDSTVERLEKFLLASGLTSSQIETKEG